jgi:hypothetical protein
MSSMSPQHLNIQNLVKEKPCSGLAPKNFQIKKMLKKNKIGGRIKLTKVNALK